METDFMSSQISRRFKWFLAILFVFLIGLYLRPVPKVTPQVQLPQTPHTQAIDLPWPASGQSAIGASGYGLLARHGDASSVPIGSTAKVITALAILRQKPIAVRDQGPTLTLTQKDVDLYNSYYSQNGSSTAVTTGEQITEYQALESLMLPSSNNMADTLAVWAFGSLDAYLKYASQMVQNIGLDHTVVGDTNGFSDTTTSTADDLVKLSLAAIKNPVFAQIVDQTTAVVPVAGTIKNTNFLLGDDGIVGIKTGHTDKAGGNYIFASNRIVAGHQITLVGAILNQPSVTTAIQSSPALIDASDSGFDVYAIAKNQTLGSYKAPWGAKSQFKSAKDVSLLVWKGSSVNLNISPNKIAPSNSGASVGQFTVDDLQQKVISDLVLTNSLPPPSPLWRIFH